MEREKQECLRTWKFILRVIYADPVIALSASVCIKILNQNHKKSPKNYIISTGENGTTNLVRTIAIHNLNSPIRLFLL